jgi:hypothetical protein
VGAAHRLATRPNGSRYIVARLVPRREAAAIVVRMYKTANGVLSPFAGVFVQVDAATVKDGVRARPYRVVVNSPTGAGSRAAKTKFPESALRLAVDAAGRPLPAEVPRLAAIFGRAEAFAGANGCLRVSDGLQADVERALGYARPEGLAAGALCAHRLAAWAEGLFETLPSDTRAEIKSIIAARLAAHLGEFKYEIPVEAIRAGQARLEAAAALRMEAVPRRARARLARRAAAAAAGAAAGASRAATRRVGRGRDGRRAAAGARRGGDRGARAGGRCACGARGVRGGRGACRGAASALERECPRPTTFTASLHAQP